MANEAAKLERWRAAKAYRSLLDADASAWAWEFARRAASEPAGVPPDICYAGPGPDENAAPTAMWRFQTDPAIPVFQAAPCGSSDGDQLDVRKLRAATLVVTIDGAGQQVLVADGPRRLRFAVLGADVLRGPVRLSFPIPTRQDAVASFDNVRRLIALRDRGWLPPALGRNAGRARRWLQALRAYDARRSGASQRDIACLFFGPDRVAEDWNGRSEYMRMRIHRLIRQADDLVAGGYRGLFGLRSAGAVAAAPMETWRSPSWR